MKVYLAVPRGFCAGVVRAIAIVELALERYGAPLYVKHQIVHNPFVVASLEKKGAVTVEDLDDVPLGATVVFSAHGAPPEDFAHARARGLRVVDATCPLVTKVHNEARKYAREGKRIILVGHQGHQEVRGTVGQGPMFVLDDRDGVELPDWGAQTPVTVLSQTTLSVDDTQRAVDAIRSRFPNAAVRNDICYATTNRQAAVKEMSGLVDVVLVIGSSNSSNCRRLYEVAVEHGVPAYLVNGPEELDPAWWRGAERVGITSGASTPEYLVEAVINTLAPEEVSLLRRTEEHISFSLPKELRAPAQQPVGSFEAAG